MKNSYLLMLALFLLLAIGLQAQGTYTYGRGIIVLFDYSGRLPSISAEATTLKNALEADGLNCDIMNNPTQAELITKINSVIDANSQNSVIFLYLRGYGVTRSTGFDNVILRSLTGSTASADFISLSEVERTLQRARARGMKPVVVQDLVYNSGLENLNTLNAWRNSFTTIYNHTPRVGFGDNETKRLINTLNTKLREQNTEIRFGELFDIVSQSISSEFPSNATFIQRPYVLHSSGYTAFFRPFRNTSSGSLVVPNVTITESTEEPDQGNTKINLVQLARNNPIPTSIIGSSVLGGVAYMVGKWIHDSKGPSKLPGPPAPPPN